MAVLIDRATSLQLGAVAAIGVATIASGGTLAPLFASILGGAGAKVAGDAIIGLIPNILSGLFSDKVKAQREGANKARRARQNHDVQQAISSAIAQCVGDSRATYLKSDGGQAYLKRIAAAIISKPLSLELARQKAG